MSMKEGKFNCIICTKTYGSKDSLTRHMKTSHLQKEYQKSAGFGVFEDMEKTQKETPKTEKKYSCGQCEYSTEKKSHLKRHVKTHLKTKIPPKKNVTTVNTILLTHMM